MKKSIDVAPTASQPNTLLALEKLVTKKGVMLGRMSQQDMLVTLSLASLSIPIAVELTEMAVNLALKRWLDDEGSMLRIDHVELRRTLIDLRYWTRDGYGRCYLRLPLPVDHIAHEHLEALQSVNVAHFVAQTRARSDARRAERTLAHAGPASTND